MKVGLRSPASSIILFKKQPNARAQINRMLYSKPSNDAIFNSRHSVNCLTIVKQLTEFV